MATNKNAALEKEEKDRAFQAEMEAMLIRAQQTTPPEDEATVLSLREESSTETAVKLNAVDLPPAGSASKPVPSDDGVETKERPPEVVAVEEVEVGQKGREVREQTSSPPRQRELESVRHARSMRAAYRNADPKVDLILDDLAKEVRACRKIREGESGVTAPVTVSQEVFNRVSYAGFARKLGKAEILTYLLEKYVPSQDSENVPKWLPSTTLETQKRSRHLSYLLTNVLDERFDWLMFRFQLARVETIEAIILRYLPAAPFDVKPRLKRIAVD